MNAHVKYRELCTGCLWGPLRPCAENPQNAKRGFFWFSVRTGSDFWCLLIYGASGNKPSQIRRPHLYTTVQWFRKCFVSSLFHNKRNQLDQIPSSNIRDQKNHSPVLYARLGERIARTMQPYLPSCNDFLSQAHRIANLQRKQNWP